MAIYEVVLEGRQGTENMLSVFHYDIVGGDPPNFQAMADVFKVHITDNLKAICPPTTTWLGITARLNVPGGVGNFYPFTGGTIAGTQADGNIYRQGVLLGVKLSNSLFKPVRGYVYQGGIGVDGLNVNGTWTIGVRTAVNNYLEAIRVIDFAGFSTATMVIVASKPDAPNTVPFNTVQQLTVRDVPSQQKRRKIGRGN